MVIVYTAPFIAEIQLFWHFICLQLAKEGRDYVISIVRKSEKYRKIPINWEFLTWRNKTDNSSIPNWLIIDVILPSQDLKILEYYILWIFLDNNRFHKVHALYLVEADEMCDGFWRNLRLVVGSDSGDLSDYAYALIGVSNERTT